METLVDKNKTAFIKGRYILDNVLAANEILHFCEMKKEQGILIKVDFEKAYDKVSWSFSKELLISRGFGSI